MFIKTLFESNPEFVAFSGTHFLTLGIILLVLVLVVASKHLHINDKNKTILKVTFIFLLTQQILLYSWYYFTGTFDLLDALPLYQCRILQLASLFAVVKHNEKIYNVLVMLNIPSAIIALLVADTNNLSFPNAMFIQFFLGHGSMLLVLLGLKYAYNYELNKKYIPLVIKTILVYFIVVIGVNLVLKSNYGYVSRMPDMFESLSFVPPIIYIPIYFLIYVGLALLTFKVLTFRPAKQLVKTPE